MKVLAFASYPIEAAATRYRLQQFVEPLADRGIALTIRPFIDSRSFKSLYDPRAWFHTGVGLLKASARRLRDLSAIRKSDVVLTQREAMIFGPPIIEWWATRIAKRPMILDLDDATYVPYTSPTYGAFGKALKWFRKTDDLIRWSTIVTCGNRGIAEYAQSKGAVTRIIPTVVDTGIFIPKPRRFDAPVVLGWIGTHSTFPYLRKIFPVLQELAQTYQFTVKIVGAGTSAIDIPGVKVDNREWRLDREVADFQSLDVGLYPIDPSLYAEKWAEGKSGFKAIQYMAVGIPFVASPVGAMADIGEVGVTHLHATTKDEWLEGLGRLLSDAQTRRTMGEAGREHALKHYLLSDQADRLAQVLKEAMRERKAS